MTAIVIPLRQRQSSNTFSQTDIAELHRWSYSAARARLFLQTDYDPQTGEERWIGRADCGSEYISVADGSPNSRLLCAVTPERAQWVLRDRRHEPLDTFGSLRAALEAVYQMFDCAVV